MESGENHQEMYFIAQKRTEVQEEYQIIVLRVKI